MDLFVNYDCDLQAANLFERTLRALCRTVRAAPAHPNPAALTLPAPPSVAALAAPGAATPDGGGGAGQAPGSGAAADAPAPSARSERSKAPPSAVAVLLALLHSLDRWAQPLLEAAEAASTEGDSMRPRAPCPPGLALPSTVFEAAALEPSSGNEAGNRVSGPGSGAGLGSGPRPDLGRAGSGGAGEVARFGAAKERKHSLENGVAVFNRDGYKGVAALLASGTVAPDARAVAAFLRDHRAVLDKVTPCYLS